MRTKQSHLNVICTVFVVVVVGAGNECVLDSSGITQLSKLVSGSRWIFNFHHYTVGKALLLFRDLGDLGISQMYLGKICSRILCYKCRAVLTSNLCIVRRQFLDIAQCSNWKVFPPVSWTVHKTSTQVLFLKNTAGTFIICYFSASSLPFSIVLW